MQLVSYRNTETGIAAKKAEAQQRDNVAAKKAEAQQRDNVVSLMDAGLLRRRDELKAELADLVRQRDEQVALVESHKEHVALLARCRADMEEHMAKAAAALTRFRDTEGRMVRTVPMDRIMRRVCRVFNVSKVDLISQGRNAHISDARQAVCYWAVRLTPLSCSQIGRMLGNRDHTTIIHGKRAYVEKRKAMGRTLRPV